MDSGHTRIDLKSIPLLEGIHQSLTESSTSAQTNESRISALRDGTLVAVSKLLQVRDTDGTEQVQVQWSNVGKEWIPLQHLNVIGQEQARLLFESDDKSHRKTKRVRKIDGKKVRHQDKLRQRRQYQHRRSANRISLGDESDATMDEVSSDEDRSECKRTQKPLPEIAWSSPAMATQEQAEIDKHWLLQQESTARLRNEFPSMPTRDNIMQCIDEFRRRTSLQANSSVA